MDGQKSDQRVCIPYVSIIAHSLYTLVSERNIRYITWDKINKITNALSEVKEIKEEPVSIAIPYFYRNDIKEFTWENEGILKVEDDYVILLPETTLRQITHMRAFAPLTYKALLALRQVKDVVLEGVPQYSKTIPPTPKVVLHYLKATGYTTQALVRQEVSTSEVEDFFANRIPISKEMANAISKLVRRYPGIDADYWMRYDNEYRVPVN